MTHPPKLIIVVPAYREKVRVGPTVKAILKYCPQVVVVDDGSGDGTDEAARQAGADVVVLPDNRGKGIALQHGFSRALERGADWVITLDADGQHDPADIPSFLQLQQLHGFEVIVGNRMTANDNMPRLRRATNRFMSWLLSRIMKQRVPDTQNGYRMYEAAVLPFLRSESKGFAAESEQLLYLAYQGFRIGSIPVRTIYGEEESKIHPFRDTVRFINMIFRFYRHRSRGRTTP